MMTPITAAPPLPPSDRTARAPMSNMRFFLTSYAGGLAVFLTILA